MRKSLAALFYLTLLAVAHWAVPAQVAPDALTVLRSRVAPGPRITPYLQHQTFTAWRQDEIRREALNYVRSPSDLLRLQRELRGKLLDMLGGLPNQKSSLNSQITGTIQMDGFRVEKLIFESLPGFHVPALVYVPGAVSSPRPAVLVPCGHSASGKSYYQAICQRLAQRGYVVLCWDPVGQGERSQFWDVKTGKSRYNLVCGEHAVLGNLAYLAGANLARWEIWDGIRALDYLLTRPEVDPNRISITGTSGGGFQTAHIAALDERVKVAAPSCYITALPMRVYNRIFEDPDSDPEQDLFGMVSDGVDHPGLLLLMYPRPVIVCAAVLDFFPIEGTHKTYLEVSEIYRRFGHPERISLTEGYHKHQYSDENQLAAFAFLDRFNGMPVREDLAPVKKLVDRALQCTHSGQVILDYKDERRLLGIIREYYLEHRKQPSPTLAELYLGSSYPHIADWPVVAYDGRSSERKIAWEAVGGSEVGGVAIGRYLLHHHGNLAMPVLHVHDKGKSGRPALLWFRLDGKAKPEDWPIIEKYVNEGYDIVSFDFRGLGEDRMPYKANSADDPQLAPSDFDGAYASPLSGVLANYVYNSILTGRPYFLQMIEDAEIAARFAREKLKAEQVFVTAPERAYTLAYSIAEAVPSITLFPRQTGQFIKWSELVDQKREVWPIPYLLPGGAYVR
ncbi:MAG TPA: acetylxylan esterase [Acidobacteriota bacterium]|jgi:hypothetical protein|nr:acetylxylan esterase [Acidobacteriota bacterium]